jgi:hypothetical protein
MCPELDGAHVCTVQNLIENMNLNLDLVNLHAIIELFFKVSHPQPSAYPL